MKGFTLIEMVVVTAVVGMMMLAVTGILISSLQSRNLTRMADVVSANGNYALEEIKKNLLNADSETVVCPVGVGSSIGFESALDGMTTTLTCTENARVASNSANLTGGEVKLSDCGSFVNCQTGMLGSVAIVAVKFSLSAGDVAGGVKDFVEKTFEMTVTLRN